MSWDEIPFNKCNKPGAIHLVLLLLDNIDSSELHIAKMHGGFCIHKGSFLISSLRTVIIRTVIIVGLLMSPY